MGMFIVAVIKTLELSHKCDLALLVEERAFMLRVTASRVKGLQPWVEMKAEFTR